MTETWMNYQVLFVLFCGMKSTLPYHMPAKQDTKLHNNNG